MEDIGAVIGRILWRAFSETAALADGRFSKSSDGKNPPTGLTAGEFGNVEERADALDRPAPVCERASDERDS